MIEKSDSETPIFGKRFSTDTSTFPKVIFPSTRLAAYLLMRFVGIDVHRIICSKITSAASVPSMDMIIFPTFPTFPAFPTFSIFPICFFPSIKSILKFYKINQFLLHTNT